MRKAKNSKPTKPETALQPTAPQTPITVLGEDEPFPSDLLLELAEREPIRQRLSDYAATIRVLRDEKNFTFREIAEWLKSHNIQADHNAVYREYTKEMSPEEAQDAALADEQAEGSETA
jgi:hypothetical protein